MNLTASILNPFSMTQTQHASTTSGQWSSPDGAAGSAGQITAGHRRGKHRDTHAIITVAGKLSNVMLSNAILRLTLAVHAEPAGPFVICYHVQKHNNIL